MNIQHRMQADWDARAKENAMYYIDTRRESWDIDTFYRQGREQATAMVRPMLERLHFEPSGKRILEIGCGIGRLFPGFADHFGEVWGIDISAEMVCRGRQVCPVPQARFVQGNGQDLDPIRDESVDYCFSYIVFQHIPDVHILWKYLDEVQRVLRPQGAFQLHFRSSVRLRSRILLGLTPQLRSIVKKLRGGRLPGDAATWTGAAVSPHQVMTRLSRGSMVDLAIVPCFDFDHRSFWVIGRKPASAKVP